MGQERETIKHPSYGIIGFSRTHCGGKGPKFFGSELDNSTYVTMNIYQGEMLRDLSRDWFHTASRTPIVQVRLTQMQFSELITSLNIGDGVPCTIEQIQGQQIPQEKEVETKKEATHRQFTDRLKLFAKTLKEKQQEAKKLVAKKTLSKDDQKDLTMHLDWLTSEITNNIPFFMECFQETMDKIVVDAKQEVEAAILYKIQVLGLETLHEQQKLLTDKK